MELLERTVEPDGYLYAYESLSESDPRSLRTGEETRCSPWRECFAVIRSEYMPAGSRPQQAYASRPQPMPEQIAARRQEIEEARRSLEREEAELDAERHARIRVQDVGRRIETDEEGFPLFDRPSQYVAAAALLAWQLPQVATPEQQRVHNRLKTLLERAAVK